MTFLNIFTILSEPARSALNVIKNVYAAVQFSEP